MPDIKNLLKQATVIRDEKKIMANTANRVGSLLVDIVKALDLPGEYLSRLKDDTAEGLITFLKGLVAEGIAKLDGGATFGDTIDSMLAGKGTLITNDGRVQTNRLEVRGSAMFHELIVNRLQALENDMTLSESGHIEKAVEQADGTWLLTLRKRWDYDWTAIDEHDVIYGEMNTLLEDGSYFTAWMRVLSVNKAANTLNVVLYDDAEVPGGRNFPPCEGMNVVHRGNAINEARQSVWYMSSREGCIVYLEGVTKPIIDQSNYYLIIGKLKRLDIFSNLPINYNLPYIYVKGLVTDVIMNAGHQANPTYEVTFCGTWDPAGQYIRDLDSSTGRYRQDEVSYFGCLWRCTVKAATVGRAPGWNNPEWVLAVGDPELKVGFEEGNYLWLDPDNIYGTLTMRVTLHGQDVTGDILPSDIEWIRKTEDADGVQRVASDAIWNAEHAGTLGQLVITKADFPGDPMDYHNIEFRLKVTLRDGVGPAVTAEARMVLPGIV